MVLAYVLRHGVTDLSPKHEGQTQIPMNEFGKSQIRDAANYIKDQLKSKPGWGVSSDLKRAEQALSISAEVLGLRTVRPMPDLRNLGDDETSVQFERRLTKAFSAILDTRKKIKSIPIIATHRSVSAWVCKQYGYVEQEMDYTRASVVWEGGIVVIDSDGARPIYKPLVQNTAEDLQPFDGTHISGFVTAEDNQPPRQCDNCKWWARDSSCHHQVVTADDEPGILYGKKRNKEGYWIMGPRDCCNNMQNKFLPAPTALH
jgi:hypothetical protein